MCTVYVDKKGTTINTTNSTATTTQSTGSNITTTNNNSTSESVPSSKFATSQKGSTTGRMCNNFLFVPNVSINKVHVHRAECDVHVLEGLYLPSLLALARGICMVRALLNCYAGCYSQTQFKQRFELQ